LAGGWLLVLICYEKKIISGRLLVLICSEKKYCWMVAGDWFVLRKNYCCLVVDKLNEINNHIVICLFWYF
jgi:hypothetical protein